MNSRSELRAEVGFQFNKSPLGLNDFPSLGTVVLLLQKEHFKLSRELSPTFSNSNPLRVRAAERKKGARFGFFTASVGLFLALRWFSLVRADTSQETHRIMSIFGRFAHRDGLSPES